MPSVIITRNDYTPTSLAFCIVGAKKGAKIVMVQNSEATRVRPLHRIEVAYAYVPEIFEAYAKEVINIGTQSMPLKKIPDRPVIGIALNNAVDHEGVQSLLQHLGKLDNADVIIRPHPNDSEGRRRFSYDRNETLDTFIRRCDVIIAGNTSVQLTSLRLGVPVIHCGSIDYMPFDLYDLVSQNKVYGCLHIPELSIDECRRFYSECVRS